MQARIPIRTANGLASGDNAPSAAKPSLTVDELQTNRLDAESFLGMLETLPSSFIYRHVLRVLAICAADKEYFDHLKSAISSYNMVPTCLFGMDGAKD